MTFYKKKDLPQYSIIVPLYLADTIRVATHYNARMNPHARIRSDVFYCCRKRLKTSTFRAIVTYAYMGQCFHHHDYGLTKLL